MLHYACPDDTDLAPSAQEKSDLLDVRLWTSLDAAKAACAGHTLVLNGSVATGSTDGEKRSVPRSAILNLDPYLSPKAVTAGGGYVVRPGVGEPDVLLILRRGVWDLPKGKLDKGETIEACALREVREEVGIGEALRVLEPLGVTVHGYPEKGKYRVKTTHWFLMQTSQTEFTPQAEEDIEAVAWVPWTEAKQRVGFETLRAHMEAVASRVLTVGAGA
ncbi:MAG: NUDIX hydrolase [Rhodothermales bacterium]